MKWRKEVGGSRFAASRIAGHANPKNHRGVRAKDKRVVEMRKKGAAASEPPLRPSSPETLLCAR